MTLHKRILPAVLVLATLACLARPLAAQQATGDSIISTRHNLSASGPGPIKVAGTQDVCKFCHTPHASNPIAPLWNRDDPGSYYQTYESTTLLAEVGQPTGTSRLCLSCHDGTIALTQTYNARNSIPGSIYISPMDAGYIGTDLTDDHPISFVYDSALAARNPQLRDPMSLPVHLPLDNQQQLQCTTCHDPHDDSFGRFLRVDNSASQLCTACHEMTGWLTSSHATSQQSLTTATRDDWANISASTVQQAACEACHRPHSSGGRQRLMRHAAEEDNCFICHDGSVASNIFDQTYQISSHAVNRTTGVHDPTEVPPNMPEHVECADCHAPHGSPTGTSGSSVAPDVKPAMRGASGLTSSGLPIPEAAFEYEVCYKCHSQQISGTSIVDRVEPNRDPAFEFAATNLSYHPVETQGRNLNVPSLIQGLTSSSIIYCTDCHNTSDGATAPQGPHGSAYRPILAKAYSTASTPEGPTAYALCYSCHNRASILNDESFDYHKKHIDDQNTSCAVCHDAHGVQNNVHLINFDRDVVAASPSAMSGPTYVSTGNLSGSCTLLCHGKDHNNETYPDD